jgi:predicted nucleic acid-binding protein
MTTYANTHYDWANVSDEYLEEIIELELKVAKRFTGRRQWEKLDLALQNVKIAQQEIDSRRAKA